MLSKITPETGMHIVNGAETWWLHGRLHRDDDLPAFIGSNGTKRWYAHGELHRDGDKPAVTKLDGTQQWYKHGKRHRDGGRPSAIDWHGPHEWRVEDRLHREGDQPARVLPAVKEWWLHGHRHRDGDQPAVVTSYFLEWWQDGIRTRANGLPCCINETTCSWWARGVCVKTVPFMFLNDLRHGFVQTVVAASAGVVHVSNHGGCLHWPPAASPLLTCVLQDAVRVCIPVVALPTADTTHVPVSEYATLVALFL